jgi:hypothetical protein
MEQITIYPSKELKIKLDNEAKAQDRSLNNLCLRILSLFFNHGNRKTKTETT